MLSPLNTIGPTSILILAAGWAQESLESRRLDLEHHVVELLMQCPFHAGLNALQMPSPAEHYAAKLGFIFVIDPLCRHVAAVQLPL